MRVNLIFPLMEGKLNSSQQVLISKLVEKQREIACVRTSVSSLYLCIKCFLFDLHQLKLYRPLLCR